MHILFIMLVPLNIQSGQSFLGLNNEDLLYILQIDQVADFGPQAGGGGRSLFCIVIATSAQGQHTLEGLVGPQ